MKVPKRIKIKLLALALSLLCTQMQVTAQHQAKAITENPFKPIPKKFDFQVSNSIILPLHSFNKQISSLKIELPLVYDYNKLALFCRFEETVAQQSNINMRFRLGSVEYVDRLEQKPYTQLNNKQ